jgi:solute carrier family 35 protein C2
MTGVQTEARAVVLTASPSASAAASRQLANDEKTAALVATCTAMLSLALLLRLAAVYLLRLKLSRGRRVALLGLMRVNLGVLLHSLDVSVYVVLWYAVSIGMTLFNKWFLRVWADGGYPFATTMTCVNMFVKMLLSRLVDRGCSSATGSRMARLAPAAYWKLAVPIGLCTALDIMLSNLSLFYITVTFYTIVKSGGNVWNLLFSILLGHQRASPPLFVVILLISSGLMLASYGSAQFVWRGFLLVLAASIIGTLRWVLTQSLLQTMDDDGSLKILAVVYYISPASAIGLLPIAVVTEASDMSSSRFLLDSSLLTMSMLFIFVSGCLAFVLIFIEISLVKKTSALSLGIAGSFKDVTQVLLAVFIFGDQLLPINVGGLVLATCGMLFYAFLKHSATESPEELEYKRVPTSSVDAVDASELSRAPTIKSDDDESERNDAFDQSRAATFHPAPQVIHMKDLRRGPSALKGATSVLRRESKEYHAELLASGASNV